MGIQGNESSFFCLKLINLPEIGPKHTTNVLKILAMFYDPIGVLQIIMINFKILFQQVCRTKIQWDEEITSDLRQNWDKILNTLENVGKISIPRDVVNQDLNDPIELIELHDFSDVSLQNYGASIYIRAISKGGNVSANLIASKSRLATMKRNTIPR